MWLLQVAWPQSILWNTLWLLLQTCSPPAMVVVAQQGPCPIFARARWVGWVARQLKVLTVEGMCSGMPNMSFCLHTASVMLCFVLPMASVAIAGYSFATLCWKLVDQALAEAMAGLGFCCPFECSYRFLGTACFDFVLPAFFGGHYLTYSTSQTLYTVPI